MPQASETQRQKWGGAQGVGEDKACEFLKSRGWMLQQDWSWQHPEGRHPTEEEQDAAQFLVDEWDWGWFVDPDAPEHFDDGRSAKVGQ